MILCEGELLKIFASPMVCHYHNVIENMLEKSICYLPKAKNIVQRNKKI